MSLEAGRTLSRYRLIEKLGEGGMGVVWKALDTRLDREVAIKILPDEFARDEQRLARFEREAKLLASLSHANIAAIHGLESVDGLNFLVMELVPGENLASRLARGTLPVEEALELCSQVALALEAAHDSGVIHRDLKPANVQVTAEGEVKVLDFGLAKAYEEGTISGDPAASPTLTAAGTAAGVILGTAAYMSPEQARGRHLDKRTDVWSFGCLLYECLTGRSAFGGETISDSLASILKVEPDWSLLPSEAPSRVRDLLERCLTKDRRMRQRDVGDARLELERARLAGPDTDSFARPVPVDAGRRSASPSHLVGALIVGAMLGAGLLAVFFEGGTDDAVSRPTRLSFAVPEGERFGGTYVSPDGSTIVYGARAERPETPEEVSVRLYIRRLDEFEPRLVENSYGVSGTCFSPDGRWLAFLATGSAESAKRQLFKVPLDGSAPPLAIAEWNAEWSNFVWPVMEQLVTLTSTPQRIVRIATDGSGVLDETDVPRGQTPGEMYLYGVLPDGGHALTTVVEHGERFLMHVGLLDLENGEARVLVEDGAIPHWFPTGHLLFTRHDTLLAVPFDLSRLEVTGGPVAIERGLRTADVYSGAQFSLSASGTLVYSSGGVLGSRRRLAFLDNEGRVEDWSTERRAITEGPVVSRDGRTVAVTVIGESGLDEVWVADVDRRALRKLVHEPGMDCDPAIFHPDGKRLAYRCNRVDRVSVHLRAADGTGEPEVLLEERTGTLWPLDFWRDGSELLVARFEEGAYAIRSLGLRPEPDGKRENEIVLAGVRSARVSHDGRWLAYEEESSGRRELYLRQVLADGSLGLESPVTTSGARGFLWFPGRAGERPRLLYVTPERQIFTALVDETGISAPRRESWIESATLNTVGEELLPDGRFLAILKGEDEVPLREYRVVLNWSEEFRRKVGAVAP